MKPIFIIGYMGCGKSTLGRNASKLSGMQFIDLDTYIVGRYHASINELFTQFGENGFRDIERRMLHEVGEFEDVIIACGGGTPCFYDNMDFMNSHGVTVWLNTGLDKLHTRLLRGRHKRPLIADKSDDELRQFIIDGLEKRSQHYSKAQHTFAGDLLETEAEVGDTARRFLTQFGINITATKHGQ